MYEYLYLVTNKQTESLLEKSKLNKKVEKKEMVNQNILIVNHLVKNKF